MGAVAAEAGVDVVVPVLTGFVVVAIGREVPLENEWGSSGHLGFPRCPLELECVLVGVLVFRPAGVAADQFPDVVALPAQRAGRHRVSNP